MPACSNLKLYKTSMKLGEGMDGIKRKEGGDVWGDGGGWGGGGGQKK